MSSAKGSWTYGVALVAVAMVPAPLAAQAPPPADDGALPVFGSAEFDGRYPARILTVESGGVLEGGRGLVGIGDTRYAILDRRFEIATNTLGDVLGIANAAFKLGLVDRGSSGPAIAVGGRYYHSYGGAIDAGVRRIAESFSDVTDSEVDVSGWVAWGTSTWSLAEGRTHLHLSLQHHEPLEAGFEVVDSEAGGGGRIEFRDGEDTSAMWAVDHQLLGRTFLVLLEAGYSWGLDRARFGAGFDAGSQNWRFLLGLFYPGVETDLATDPREFEASPVVSLHYRF